jgi:hypothetical protein
MPRTALDEMWGGYVVASNVDQLVPLPSGVPGAARLIGATNTSVLLQDARLLPVGGPVYTVWNNQASLQCAVKNRSGTQLTLLNPNAVAVCYLVDNSTEAGTWIVENTQGAASSPQTITVDEFTIELGPGTNLQVNIRSRCNQLGYTGANPARVQVFVGPQGSATVGAVGNFTRGQPAMDTGTFPAGSVIILTVLENGYITGRGGTGGTGQPITGGTPSSPQYGSVTVAGDGDDGLYVRTNTVLYNYGRIQGGGGGGSGGGAQGSVSGPGGGGGAGYWPSPRGVQGSVPAGQGFGVGGNGQNGVLNTPGLGGGVSNGAPAGTGGTGGEPGQNGGDSSDTAGGFGQAGFAIKVASGVTLTKVVAGNIDGSEGTL